MVRGPKIVVLTLICCVCMGVSTFADEGQNTLAVFSLRPTNFEAMGYNIDILYALISALEKHKSVEVLPRREMEQLLFQSGLTQSDNLSQVQKAGNAIGVDFVIFGSVTKSGQAISASLHLLDVNNQKILNSWSPTFAGPAAIKTDIPAIATDLETAIRNKGSLAASRPMAATRQIRNIENLAVQAKSDQVVITWQHTADQPAAGFNVYRAAEPEGPYQFIGRTTEYLYNDAGVKSGRQYYYRVGLIEPNGNEIMSPLTVDINFTGEKVPHPPLIISASGHIRRAVIEFVPSLQNTQEKFKITGYEIFRRSGDDASWQPLFSIGSGMRSQSKLGYAVEDKAIDTDGGIYRYAIKSMDHKRRESALSDAVEVKIPDPPELRLEKDNLLRRVDLGWRPLSFAQGYYLYRKTHETDWTRVSDISGAERAQYTDDHDLADDTDYQYYLTAYDQGGQTGKSNVVQAHTKRRPPIPTNLAAESGLVKAVNLTWSPILDPDVGGYLIYRGTQPDTLTPIAKVKGYQIAKYMDKGKFLPSLGALLKKGQLFSSLEDGQIYYYAVAGFNLFDGEGDHTQPVTATTKPRPDPVATLTVTGEQRQIVLRWDKSPAPDIAFYKILRSRNESDWSEIKEVDAAENAYRDTDLKPELKYRYRIIAEDQDGLQSDPVESDTIASPVPKAGS